MTWLHFISLGLTAFYVGLILYFLWGWLTLKTYRLDKKTEAFATKVSIIIPARNEADKIGQVVADCLAQDYPQDLVELIVVDDFSTDTTPDLVKAFQDDRLKLIQLSDHFQPDATNSWKKQGIALAVDQSHGDLIVTTDADCRMGAQWLASIVHFYEANPYKLISGPVAYINANTPFKQFQALDFLSLIGIGAASISNHFPIMCNGANLAYEKAAFYEVGGFEGVDDIASGDDMLLLHKFSKHYSRKIGFLKNPAALVWTYPVAGFNAFLHQRIRWTSKSFKYDNKLITVLLGLAWCFHLSLLLNLALAAFVPSLQPLAFYQLFAKLGIDLLFLAPLSIFFQRKQLLWLFLPSQLLHLLYVIVVGVLGIWGKYQWKGRWVK